MVSKDAHLGDETINEHKEGSRECWYFWEGRDCVWGRHIAGLLGWLAKCSTFTCGWLPGRLLFNHSQGNATFGLCRFCVSELYFTLKKTNTFLFMSLLGVHITYSLSGIWLWECLVIMILYLFFTKRKVGNSSGNTPVGLSGCLIRIEKKGGKRPYWWCFSRFWLLKTPSSIKATPGISHTVLCPHASSSLVILRNHPGLFRGTFPTNIPTFSTSFVSANASRKWLPSWCDFRVTSDIPPSEIAFF